MPSIVERLQLQFGVESSGANTKMVRLTTIGHQADSAILRHLLSKDKDRSLDYFKKYIDWDYKDSRGVQITEKKVRNF